MDTTWLVLIVGGVYLIVVTSFLWAGVIGKAGPTGSEGPMGPEGPPGPSAATTNQVFVAVDGSDTNDGGSWSTAYRTLHEAVARAPDGSDIVVGPGTYEPTQGELLIDRPLRVVAFDGAEHTTITRSLTSAPHRLVRLAHPQAALVGFTLENGKTSTDSGTWVDREGGNVYIENYGRLSDCVCRNGSAFQYGGNVFVWDGFVERCEVSYGHHRYTTNYGIGSGIYIAGTAVVDSCYAHHNEAGVAAGIGVAQASVDTLVINCTVTENTGFGAFGVTAGGYGVNCGGGSADNCLLRNTIVYGNTPVDAGFYALSSGINIRNNCMGTTEVLFGAAPSGPGNISADPQLRPDGSIPIGSSAEGAGYLARSLLDIRKTPRLTLSTPSMGSFVASD